MNKLLENMTHKTKWRIERYNSDEDVKLGKPYDVSEFEGNILLNEGIDEMEKLICGVGSPTAFNSSNAYIGVGDSSTTESASQTGLQASTNKTYKGMDQNYPVVSDQVMTFRATFGSSDANFDWREFTVANGNSDSAKNMNRKVSNQGTKASGQTWVVTLTITLS